MMKKNSKIILGIIAVLFLLLVVFRVVSGGASIQDDGVNPQERSEEVFYTFEEPEQSLDVDAGSSIEDIVIDEADVTSLEIDDSASQDADDSIQADGLDESNVGDADAFEETKQTDAVVIDEAKELGAQVSEDGTYTSKDEVALYIHLYGHLPENYISKKDAEAIGYSGKGNELWDVAPGKSIGGSRFGNYEGILPDKKGRKYFECDIDYNGKKRNAKRIVYSNDGLIYYTEDHYETFELLYAADTDSN